MRSAAIKTGIAGSAFALKLGRAPMAMARVRAFSRESPMIRANSATAQPASMPQIFPLDAWETASQNASGSDVSRIAACHLRTGLRYAIQPQIKSGPCHKGDHGPDGDAEPGDLHQ